MDNDNKDDDKDKEVREQDRYLPINNVQRIMKRALPEGAKMSKEAKQCVQECATEFIGFVTSEVLDRISNEKRKSVTGEDVVDGMRALGFDAYMAFIHIYLGKLREVGIAEKKAKAKKKENGVPTTAAKPGRKRKTPAPPSTVAVGGDTNMMDITSISSSTAASSSSAPINDASTILQSEQSLQSSSSLHMSPPSTVPFTELAPTLPPLPASLSSLSSSDL